MSIVTSILFLDNLSRQGDHTCYSLQGESDYTMENMRQMMEYAYKTTESHRVPVILDTDDKDKAARYEHLGMKLDRVRNCGERFHMYDLICEIPQ